MISIYTPTHNPKYLLDCYLSLSSQTFKDWEWVILANGKADIAEIEQIVGNDSRVNIQYAPQAKGIGELKSMAVSIAKYDYLLELDHDDILREDALERVVEAFERGGFVFSAFAQINEDKSPNKDRFDDVYGWKDKITEFAYTSDLLQGNFLKFGAFSDHPHNYARIYSQPNHLRAFTREAYDKAGGYDKEMVILDDQDLISRLYKVTNFVYIDEPLYFQRVHANNSQKSYTKEIPELCETLYVKHIQEMMEKWSKDNNLNLVDLGGGFRGEKGYTTIDLHDADITADLNKGIPLPDNSVGVVRAVDFLEHIPDKIGIINEIYRVLAVGGMLISLTPSTDGWGAFSDPTHVAYYNERSFWYYTRKAQRDFVPQIKAKFHTGILRTEDTSHLYGKNNKHVRAYLIKKDNLSDFHGLTYGL